MPELPVAWTMPAQTPKLAAETCRAAKAIGAIIMPEQPMPMMLCASSMLPGPLAAAASSAPAPAIASSASAVRRDPKRSSATPTGTIASAKASGKAPVTSASVSGPRPRSRCSMSAVTAGRVRTALLKTWPMVRARICRPTGKDITWPRRPRSRSARRYRRWPAGSPSSPARGHTASPAGLPDWPAHPPAWPGKWSPSPDR